MTKLSQVYFNRLNKTDRFICLFLLQELTRTLGEQHTRDAIAHGVIDSMGVILEAYGYYEPAMTNSFELLSCLTNELEHNH